MAKIDIKIAQIKLLTKLREALRHKPINTKYYADKRPTKE